MEVNVHVLLAPAAVVCVCCWLAAPAVGDDGKLALWPVDPLVKVFRDDTQPQAAPEATAEVARGEHATFQLVARADRPITALQVEAGAMALESDPKVRLIGATVRFVGYVPVDRPIHTPPSDQLRKPPADFPDPLFEQPSINVPAGEAQPIWITLTVPTTARPGMYHGSVRVRGKLAGRQQSTTMNLSLKVFNVSVDRTRLWVTNWFDMHWRHMKINPKVESSEYWALLRRYARQMAEYRQNVALIPPVQLAKFSVAPGGKLRIDFSRFDRWVEIFTEEGVIGRIEGGHLGNRLAGWPGPFGMYIREVRDGKIAARLVEPDAPEADKFCAAFLPALRDHLRAKGWLKIYMQHVADEPMHANTKSYRACAALVRKYAPELRIIEALVAKKHLTGSIDIWVPELEFLKRDDTFYQARRKAGDELWFYTCIFPQGEYANRFIEQPLIKTRLLHWINYRFGATGYLHWGYNKWTKDNPLTHTTAAHSGPPYLPAGDPWIVYPGAAGPLASIRQEAMRDGIVDHELLSRLGERDPAAAKRLVKRHILAYDRYQSDLSQFRATRRELLTLVSELPSAPPDPAER